MIYLNKAHHCPCIGITNNFTPCFGGGFNKLKSELGELDFPV